MRVVSAKSGAKSARGLDRLGVFLSGLCAAHCVIGLLLVAGLGIGGGLLGGWLLHPDIHRVGLALATLVAGGALWAGALRHRRRLPLVLAAAGLTCMAGALAVGHGVEEAVLTVIGVGLVGAGHLLNLRN